MYTTHSLVSSYHYFYFKFDLLGNIEKWGWTNGWATCVKIVIAPTVTVGRPSGSIEGQH